MESKMMMTINQARLSSSTKKMPAAATATKTIRVKVPTSNKQPSSPCFTTRLLIQNHSNFKRSGEPARVMYYEDGSWIDFGGEVVSSLRAEFLERKPMVEAWVKEMRCLFDFLRMLQIDFATGKQRSIAWIDVDGKCFFPKSFVGDDFTSVSGCASESTEEMEDIEIEIEVRVNENSNSKSNSGKRKREVVELDEDDDEEEEKEEQSDESCSNNQENLSKRRRLATAAAASDAAGIPRWPSAKPVKEEERVHAVVTKLFLSGVKNVDHGATITSIYQCTRTGPMEKARWEVFKRQTEVTKTARGAANTIFAWYGTSAKGVESILMHGFGMPSKVSGSEAYGIGIHLSPVSLPHLSVMQSEVDDNGEKHVILCRVILGNVEKVEAASRQSHPSGVNFDTGVDDLKNPKRYVVWYANMNTHVIPECVVSYKSSDNLSARLGESAFMKWVPNATNSTVVKLFSKLEGSLPSEKVQELKSLCSIYKAGKMGKDMFVKQLRVISGDEMLLSTIRETRGSE